MARRGSFITALARDMARAQRQAEAQQRRAIADQQRAARAQAALQREALRLQAAQSKLAQQQYIELRVAEVAAMTLENAQRLLELQKILAQTLDVDDRIDFETLRIRQPVPEYRSAPSLATPIPPPDREAFVGAVKKPGTLQKLVPGSQNRHAQALRDAEARYEAAQQDHAIREAARQQQLAAEAAAHHQWRQGLLAKIQQRDQEVDALQESYRAGDPATIATYVTMVLERSTYPDGFPSEFRVAYVPESRELVVEYELPTPAIVPAVAEYKYTKTRDVIEEKPRKAAEIKELYQDVVAAVCLRTIHEVFESDLHGHIDVAVFNGYVQAIDRATGRDIRPHLVSVRVTRERFLALDLRRIDLRACLRNLGAQVSPRPDELQPVKPVVEFSMVDRRFVEQSDVLGGIDQRPNLMDLTPTEFEHLVSNLFGKMGLETKLTRSSRDGGVDAVAFDTRPIIGGKVVIQAKRYRNTVGVSAVRDLYGTMMNEGANKGILVATSGYGPDAFDFAKDKPIELVDGGGLLYLLDQVGVQAKIIFPLEG